MIDFIVKYWLEFLFSIIAAGLGIFARHYYKLWQESQNLQKEKIRADILKEMQNENQKQFDKLQSAIDQLMKFVLTVQGKQFRTDCKDLLTDTRSIITYDQFDNLHTEYEIYTSLGGNGLGQELFRLVQEKYSNQITGKDYANIFSQHFRPCTPGSCEYYIKTKQLEAAQLQPARAPQHLVQKES